MLGGSVMEPGDVVLNQTVAPRLEPELKGRSVFIGVRVKFGVAKETCLMSG